MAELIYKDKKIYYEVHGDGDPLIILNGIMMSHLSWIPFIQALTNHRKVILFDFLDQGFSEKATNMEYQHDFQIGVLQKLISELNLAKVDLLGVSYGAQVALQYAIIYPNQVGNLLIFNAATYTTPWLRDIGRAWIGAAKTYDSEHFFYVTMPYIYSSMFYNKNIAWMAKRKLLFENFNKEFFDSMVRLINSSEAYDVRGRLDCINAKTLVVAADNDYITPAFETEKIAKAINGSSYFLLQGCGHASMYEKANEFLALVNGFLVSKDQIEIA